MTITVEAFEAGEVDPSGFDHEAHIRVAWMMLDRVTLIEAIRRYTGALRRLTKKLGMESKYHETISWFFLILIAERKIGAPARNWQAFKRANPDLFDQAGDLLARHYSPQRLNSAEARRRFVLPDI